MRRFNLGFGNFGPLEQCNNGKYMLAKETLPILDAALRRAETAEETERRWNSHYASLHREYYTLGKDYDEVNQENKKLRSKNEVLVVANAISVALVAIGAFYLARCA